MKLNEDKSESLLVGKTNDLRRLTTVRQPQLCECIWYTTKETKNVVRDLGVLLDCHLSFHNQVNNAVKAIGYHLRNIDIIKNIWI